MMEWIFLLIFLWTMTLFAPKLNHLLLCLGFSFFDGILLSMLCFWLLPEIFSYGWFWWSAMSLLFGVFTGAICEEKGKLIFSQKINTQLINSSAVTICILSYCFIGNTINQNSLQFSIWVSFLGGLFLLIACGGILPEEYSDMRNFFLIGGLIGFLWGVFKLMM